MEIFRVTLRWTGFNGAPGYSAFHFAGGGGLISDAQQVADRAFEAAMNLGPVLPSTVSVNLQPEVERLDSDTGEMLGYETLSTNRSFSGADDSGYSASSGAVVNWRTGDVRFGRRIRGRTFLVPLGGDAYQSDGSLTGNALEEIGDFATEMRAGDFDSEFGVWSRPRDGSGGVFATVTGHSVPDMAAVLRSRRD